jgi:hypothetical protein
LISTKGWTLAQLIKKSPNFRLVDRVRFDDPMLIQTIRIHEDSGAPLIIEGFHEHDSWPTDLFTLDWLSVHGKPGASARNFTLIKMKPSDFMAKMRNALMSGQLGYQRLASFQVIFCLTEPMIT